VREDAGVPEHPLVTTDVELAARLLAVGGLVGLPTETVYGLAADAQDVAAVARVFAMKGRPADHPLIVHLAGAEDLDAWACDVPEYARRLAQRLWPGPLSLVLPRSRRAGDHVTGGQPTVALRVPSHPVARRLLAACGPGRGLAAPSANRFGRVSPTTAAHVLAELGELLVPGRDVILDGGASEVGVESAIVDCTGERPVILRPGAITADRLGEIGGVPVADRPSRIRVPGTLASHYAPRAQVVLVPGPEELLEALTAPFASARPVDGLLAPADVTTPAGVVRLSAPPDAAAYARVLYAALREADALGLQRVLAVPPAPDGIGTAVLDRLHRAAHHD
jgi:L-threonylcarbamoyladenylate synthase